MHASAIFCKTDKGRLEVKTRSDLIDQRCRSLLLLVDGKTPAPELIARVAGLAITREHFQKLIDLELVAPVDASAASLAPTASAPVALERRSPAVEAPAVHITDAEKFIQAGNFMNQTAKDLMGLFAAVGFQQKVALASSLDDLRKLRQPMVDAITKSKGESFARGMAAELDRLLGQ
ncbi:MAG: hypothetical protein CFE43_03830 [Burkholderiales bacterium PBB3]|nr:MAG: hypothetical protein CFE43_03830 [Burkholderiales bacterium PBB3]